MRRHLWWILGLVLAIGGVVVALSARPGPADFGWFAYTPLDDGPEWQLGSNNPFGGSALIVARWQVAGWALAVVGLMLVAAGVGFRLGRRRGPAR